MRAASAKPMTAAGKSGGKVAIVVEDAKEQDVEILDEKGFQDLLERKG